MSSILINRLTDTDKQRHRHTEKQRQRQTDRRMEGWTDRQAHRPINNQKGRLAGRQTNRQKQTQERQWQQTKHQETKTNTTQDSASREDNGCSEGCKHVESIMQIPPQQDQTKQNTHKDNISTRNTHIQAFDNKLAIIPGVMACINNSRERVLLRISTSQSPNHNHITWHHTSTRFLLTWQFVPSRPTPAWTYQTWCHLLVCPAHWQEMW